MEWLILLLLFGAGAFLFGRYYVARADRAEEARRRAEAGGEPPAQ